MLLVGFTRKHGLVNLFIFILSGVTFCISLWMPIHFSTFTVPIILTFQFVYLLSATAQEGPFRAIFVSLLVVLEAVLIYAFMYMLYGIEISETKIIGSVEVSESIVVKQTPSIDYIYFSIVTWTTLGYGDIKPTDTVKILAATQSIVGHLYMGLFGALVYRFVQTLVECQEKRV